MTSLYCTAPKLRYLGRSALYIVWRNDIITCFKAFLCHYSLFTHYTVGILCLYCLRLCHHKHNNHILWQPAILTIIIFAIITLCILIDVSFWTCDSLTLNHIAIIVCMKTNDDVDGAEKIYLTDFWYLYQATGRLNKEVGC